MQRTIECHALVYDAEEARNFIWSRPPPQRCISVFTGDGDSAFPDRNYQSNKVKDVFCLQRNVEAEIAHMEQEVRKIQKEANELTAEYRQLDGRINDTNKELRNCKHKVGRDQDKQNRLQADVAELANYEEDAPLDVATLEEDVHNFDRRLEELQNEKQEAQEQVNEIMPLLQQQQEEQNTFQQQREDITQRADALKVNTQRCTLPLVVACRK